jgi:hypothetical protein
MSKNVKNIEVRVTFKVGLGSLEIPKKVYEELAELHDKQIELDSSDLDYPNANEWLVANIKHRDCFECQFEIEDLS